MKKGIHPICYTLKVVLSDGDILYTKSTMEKEKILLEIDTKTHPAWTKSNNIGLSNYLRLKNAR
ncbi:MAG: 50S ribosomal protein L31 [Candidatus Hodgkinia cicadicola]